METNILTDKINSEIPKQKTSDLESMHNKILLFLSSYVAALIITGLALSSLGFQIVTLFWLFPTGFLDLLDVLSRGFANNFRENSILVGYTVYLVVLIPGVLIKNRRVFIVLYFIFVVLLIGNITGCVYLVNNLH